MPQYKEIDNLTSCNKPNTILHVKSLDGFRAIAVIGVLLVHWGILGVGWIGVQIFFVLSGFLITSNLLRDRCITNSIIQYLKSFYWRRFLRLFPIYYLYVIGFILIGIILKNHEITKLIIPLITYTVNIYAILQNHANLQNVGHFWSLAVEFQFYLLWPFLIFYFSKRHFGIIVVFLLFVIPFLRLVFFLFASQLNNDLHYAGEFINFVTVTQMDSFAMGALIAILPKTKIKRPQFIFYAFLLLCVIIGGLNLISLFGSDLIHNKIDLLLTLGFPYLMINNYQYVWGYTLLNVLAGTLIWCIVNNKNPLPILNSSVLVYIGRISYGIYIFHVPVLFFIRKMYTFHFFSPKGIILLIVYFLITFLIAHFSFNYFEKLFLKLKNNVSIKKM